MNYNEFAEKIKAKYPDYAEMDNRKLAETVIQKYPIYKNQVTFDVAVSPNQNQMQSSEAIQYQNNNTELAQNTAQAKEQLVPQNGVLTGGISQNVRTYWDKNGRIHYANEDEIPKMNWFQLQGRKIKSAAINLSNWINNTNTSSDDYKQKANLILAAETLPLGLGKTITQAGANYLRPYLGKAISKGVTEGIGSGFVGGAVEGVGRGFIEGENPIKTGVNDALIGATVGGLGSAAILGGVKMFRGNQLRNMPNKTRADKKAIRKVAKEYYKDYIQQTNVNRKDLGKIYFGDEGLQETLNHHVKNSQNFLKLKNNIINAEYIGEEVLLHPRKDDIIKFHRLKKDGEEYLIGETSKGKKYYLSKNATPEDLTANTEDTSRVANNIITDNGENFNPNITIGKEIPQNIGIKEFDKPDVIYSEKTIREKQKEIISEINELKESDIKKNYVTRRRQGRFWRVNTDDPYSIAAKEANIEFNSIIDEIKKAPSLVFNIKKVQELERRLETKLNTLEPEHTEGFWTKFYQAVNKAGEYSKISEDLTKANNMRASGELKRSKLPQSADLPKDVSKMANAAENAAEYEVLHNNDLIAQSQQMVNSNPEILKSDLLKKAGEKDTNFEALDFENARQLVTKLLNEGRTEEALDLIESVATKGSKAGQAVQSMSLWSLQTPEGAILQGQKIIDKYNRNIKNPSKKIPKLSEEQAKNLADLANDVLKQTDDRLRDVATAKLLKYQAELVPVSGWQKVKTLRNISLLLNPKTLVRNIVGNGLFAGVESGSKSLASGIDNILSNFTRKRTRVMPQFKEAIDGAIRGTKEGFEDAMLGIDTRAGIGGRFDLPTQRSFKDPILGGLETALDIGLRVPDRTFFQGVMDESIANQLKAQGLKEATPEIIEQARQEALESVFQNDSAISKGILGARKALNNLAIRKEFGLGDLIIPFAQTPANIIQQGINYSPFGAIKAGINFAKGNQRQGTLDLARSLVGSGIMAGGYAGAQSNILNGDIEDYKLRKNLETINERPFQMTLPNGSKMSYSQLQPISIPLSAGTALAQNDKEKAVQASLGTLLDLPMLDSIGRAVSDTQNYGIGTAAINMGMSFPTQFVPTAINQLNSFIDPYQRETYDSNPIMRGVNQARNKMPFASKTLPKKYDVTGEPVKRYQSEGITKVYDAFINPVFINKPEDDLVMQEVAALTKETGENGGLLNIPEKKIKLDDGTTKQLNNKEFSEYSRRLGEVTYAGYEKIMQTQRYINADDQTRLKLLSDIKKNAKAIVQEELFGKVNKNNKKNSINKKIENRLNKGQRRRERIFGQIDKRLINNIMYGE